MTESLQEKGNLERLSQNGYGGVGGGSDGVYDANVYP